MWQSSITRDVNDTENSNIFSFSQGGTDAEDFLKSGPFCQGQLTMHVVPPILATFGQGEFAGVGTAEVDGAVVELEHEHGTRIVWGRLFQGFNQCCHVLRR